MQNIKNFTLITPTEVLIKKYQLPTGEVPQFLQSEDGLEWYAAQELFDDDTVKIQYRRDGVIRAVVDKPVPQRGNIYAVSMLWPVNDSVAEIAVSDYPVGCVPDGTWVYDSGVVYQDPDLQAQSVLRKNTARRKSLMADAAVAAFSIQASAAIGNPREGDADNLLLIQQYADALRDVDVTLTEPVWPAEPECLG